MRSLYALFFLLSVRSDYLYGFFFSVLQNRHQFIMHMAWEYSR